MNKLRLILLATATIALGACSTLPQSIEADANHLQARTDRLQRDVGRIDSVGRAAQPVVFEDGVFVGRNTIKIQTVAELPPIFNEEAWFNQRVNDLREFGERITLRTRIPVSITPDAYRASLGQENGLTTAGLPPVPGGAPGGSQGGMAGYNPIDINYSGGPLRGLLDMAAARYGVYWAYRDGEIRFFLHDTKTFEIRAVPGNSKVDALVATASGTVTGGAGSDVSSQSGDNSQSTSVSSELSVWDGLGAAIEAMLSSTGRVVVSPSTSSITVTDTPSVIQHVSDFVEKQNNALSKQVMITVEVLGVSRRDSDSYSISWDLVYETLSRRFGLTNNIVAAPGASNLTLGVISPSSRWSGSQAVVSALSEQGRVNLETTASVVALNNQPAPIRTTKQVTYLAQSSTTNTTDVGSTVALTPGSVSTGFSMQVLPSIMSDGTLMLQFSADISDLREIRQITSGDVTIEAPEVDTKSFLQRIRMKSGETLVLSGFEETNGNLRYEGVGKARNPFFGGGMRASQSKDSVVVLVTPVIVN